MREADAPTSPSLSDLHEATDLLPAYLEIIKKRVESAGAAARRDGIETCSLELGSLADRLNQLVSVFACIARDCRVISPRSDIFNEEVRSLQIHLLSVLKAIQTAESQKDTEMLVDLLEYELQDNLTQWKIKAIPKLREFIRAAKA